MAERIAPSDDDLPEVVRLAMAERERDIAAGVKVPEFDADGFEIGDDDG